jgi:hypothetical protein
MFTWPSQAWIERVSWPALASAWPQPCRGMCVWMGNGRPARRPMVLICRLIASAVNGPPRSGVNTWLASGYWRRRSQQPLLVARDRVRGRRVVLDAADVLHRIAAELDLRPLEVGELLRPQAVTVAHQDQEMIAQAVAAGPGRADEAVDLAFGQMLARPQRCIRRPAQRNFPIYGVWHDEPQP